MRVRQFYVSDLLLGCLCCGLLSLTVGCSPSNSAPETTSAPPTETQIQSAQAERETHESSSPQANNDPSGVTAAQRTDDSTSQPAVTVADDPRLLVDVTQHVGLAGTAPTWPDGVYLTPEITPGGVGLFDYDQDGDLDIYQICHGRPAEMPAAFQDPAPNRLFRQEANGQFVEVAGAAGLGDPGYGHGCAMGDIDNDGDVDVFVTNYGNNVLYLNEGQTFRNITQEAGIQGADWSSAAAFFDYDRDGDLDLSVVNFGVFDATRRCGGTGDGSAPDYCGPHLFDGVTDQLYRNNGDGTFTDVSTAAGITVPARGWGVICADLTDDGWPDIYVCNDEEPNQLWVNGRDGTFFDEAMLRGAALNGFGRVEASMGVAVGDINADGKFDLFMTHVASESNTLYAFGNEQLFTDATPQAGMANIDLPYTGWGCGLVDIDHDGDLDLAIANGRVAAGPTLPAAKLGAFWNRYAEPNLLFLNSGSGRFSNASSRTGDFFQRPGLTRGLAFGDLDNDGDIDLVTNSIDNRVDVYRNDAPPHDHHWLQLTIVTGNRAAIGAKVTLHASDVTQIRYLLRSYSYLASNDPRVHFGLGRISNVDNVLVEWPDGEREQFEIPGVDRTVEIHQGQGTSVETPNQ